MRLAFDLDGVLADLGSALTREALRLFPEIALVHPPEPASVAAVPDVSRDEEAIEEPVTGARMPDLTSAQHRILWDEVRQIDNFWETLDEIETGVIRQLWCLARERKWDVVFVTSRPSSTGDCVQVQTQRWLESRGFVLPSTLVVHGNRGKVADALDLDVLVDDRPENCLDVVLESRARAILVWRDTAAKAPANARRLEIGTVRTVAECLAVLAQVDHPGQTSTGLMVTLRHLLGLKPTRAIAGRRPSSSLVRRRSKL